MEWTGLQTNRPACRINGWPWMIYACLLSAMILVAGCDRAGTRSQAPPPDETHTFGDQGKTTEKPELFAGPLPAPAPKSKPGSKREAADAVFTNCYPLRIDIEIPRAGMNALRRTGGWGNGKARPTAKATVREGGAVYKDVAVHLKGSAGSFRSVDDKPGLTLKFDKFVAEQRFHGLNKISLNNSVQDSSYLCEKIGRELFIAAGVPVPRAAHALVTLNGRDLGLFVLLEGANKQFLKRYFDQPGGNLYDGGFCQDLSNSLHVNSGDNQREHSALRALNAVRKQGKPTFDSLQQVLDVDRFVTMLALEILLWHWDGYTLNVNNWRIFHDLESNRMVFIPHGLDQLFGQGRPLTGTALVPQQIRGDVSRIVLGTRDGQRLYRERLSLLYTNVFKAEDLAGRVDEISQVLVPGIAETHPEIARSVRGKANQLKQRIVRRGEVLRAQLGPSEPPVEFGSEGVLPLAGWKPFVNSGEPKLAEVQDAQGRALLAINAGGAISSSSWRTRVALAAGEYRLEGRLRLSGVSIDEGDTRAGAGMRISKGDMPPKLTGTAGWTDFRYPFTVDSGVSNVELICELRATKGEAWFDTASLRLVRLP